MESDGRTHARTHGRTTLVVKSLLRLKMLVTGYLGLQKNKLFYPLIFCLINLIWFGKK